MRIGRLEFGIIKGTSEWSHVVGSCKCHILSLGLFFLTWLDKNCKCDSCKRHTCVCPKDSPELIALKKLMFDQCHWISPNLNDTFHYAGADGENIDANDMEILFPLYLKYGFSAIIAYVSVKRGYDPLVRNITEKYQLAKKEIEALKANDGFWDIEE